MKRQILVIIACAICLSGLVSWTLSRQDKPAAGRGRTVEEINKDLQAHGSVIREALSDEDSLFNPAKRRQHADKVIPAIKKMLVLFDELASVEPAAKEQVEGEKLGFSTILALFGDADARAALQKRAAGNDDQAAEAQGALLLARWWEVGTDPAAQARLLDELRQIAKAKPQSDAMAATLFKMSRVGAASEGAAEGARDIIVNDLTGEQAKKMGEMIKGERRLRASVGKPIEITGKTLDGKTFTSRDWRGKVVLVDFWATWCPPCIAAFPHLKQIYQKYHPKGLEIVGVSWDDNPVRLKEFLANDPGLAWPQLYSDETEKLEAHPLARELGVSRLPTLLLIDRKGILRSHDAAEKLDELIPKLLLE
jgi:thiol-disulfide isomerase/thioredoxin